MSENTVEACNYCGQPLDEEGVCPTAAMDRVCGEDYRRETELRDAWEGEGNSGRVTFDEWVRAAASNDHHTLQDACKRYLSPRVIVELLAVCPSSWGPAYDALVDVNLKHGQVSEDAFVAAAALLSEHIATVEQLRAVRAKLHEILDEAIDFNCVESGRPEAVALLAEEAATPALQI